MTDPIDTDIEDDDFTGEIGEAETLTDEVMIAEVTAAEAGDRLDRALRFGDLSRARIQALISEGRLCFEGAPVTDGKHKARPGIYTLSVPAPISAIPQPQNLNLEVLFEDAHLIVVNKPVGMAAHPGPGTPDGTWSMPCCFIAAHRCRVSAACCGRESCTASTRTPRASWSPPSRTPPTAA